VVSSVVIEAGLVVEPVAYILVGPANGADIGRASITLLNLLLGLGSFEYLDRDLPNPKSLAKNPRFSTFCLTNNGLRVTIIAGEIFTGEGWVGLLSNKDEGCGASGSKPGRFSLDVDAKAGETGSGQGC